MRGEAGHGVSTGQKVKRLPSQMGAGGDSRHTQQPGMRVRRTNRNETLGDSCPQQAGGGAAGEVRAGCGGAAANSGVQAANRGPGPRNQTARAGVLAPPLRPPRFVPQGSRHFLPHGTAGRGGELSHEEQCGGTWGTYSTCPVTGYKTAPAPTLRFSRHCSFA